MSTADVARLNQLPDDSSRHLPGGETAVMSNDGFQSELIDRGLDVLSPRWTTEVLIELLSGRRRTTDILKALPGLSAKTLSERLKKLRQAGLIERTVYAEVPPRVEYEIVNGGSEIAAAFACLEKLARTCRQWDRQQAREA